MKIHFTEHARLRLIKRKLEQAWVEQVIQTPKRIEQDGEDDELEHRLGFVPELANRVLRVIVSKGDPKRVITVYLDRQFKGKL